jgi:hypothetical protein
MLCFVKVEKLDFPAMLNDSVVDQLDNLFATDPAMWVEYQVEDTLLEHDGVERRLEVLDRPSPSYAVAKKSR